MASQPTRTRARGAHPWRQPPSAHKTPGFGARVCTTSCSTDCRASARRAPVQWSTPRALRWGRTRPEATSIATALSASRSFPSSLFRVSRRSSPRLASHSSGPGPILWGQKTVSESRRDRRIGIGCEETERYSETARQGDKGTRQGDREAERQREMAGGRGRESYGWNNETLTTCIPTCVL